MSRKIPLTKNKFAIIDEADFERVSTIKWWFSSGYARGWDKLTKKQVKMHRFIMSTAEDTIVDHINRNPLDNRKINLRAASRGQNKQNSIIPKNNTTGYKGVYLRKDRENRKWRALIRFEQKLILLGDFLDPRTAALMYDIAAREQHGEHAYSNFPKRHNKGKPLVD